MIIMSIDPGNIETAYCLIDKETQEPLEFNKIKNDDVLEIIKEYNFDEIAIEMVASYGMSVGETVFETCLWIGRFIQKAEDKGIKITKIYRKDVKINLCNSMRAKDSNIRQALIDRFGVVGVKDNKGFFYGFKADIWSAYAVGITYIDMEKNYDRKSK